MQEWREIGVRAWVAFLLLDLIVIVAGLVALYKEAEPKSLVRAALVIALGAGALGFLCHIGVVIVEEEKRSKESMRGQWERGFRYAAVTYDASPPTAAAPTCSASTVANSKPVPASR